MCPPHPARPGTHRLHVGRLSAVPFPPPRGLGTIQAETRSSRSHVCVSSLRSQKSRPLQARQEPAGPGVLAALSPCPARVSCRGVRDPPACTVHGGLGDPVGLGLMARQGGHCWGLGAAARAPPQFLGRWGGIVTKCPGLLRPLALGVTAWGAHRRAETRVPERGTWQGQGPGSGRTPNKPCAQGGRGAGAGTEPTCPQ